MFRGIMVITALILALGVGLGGYFVGNGFYKGRLDDRFVTVKGLAEREVKADLANWPISFSATGDDLAAVQKSIDQAAEHVRGFLREAGFTDAEVATKRVEVEDLYANPYRQNNDAQNRFILSQTIHVRSTDVDKVDQAARRIGDLIRQGVILRSQGPSGPGYAFTRLNDIKPEMIAEAIQAAREGAAQFARESGSELHKIRRANQGVFSILPRDSGYEYDESRHLYKRVRVVSTIDYYLRD